MRGLFVVPLVVAVACAGDPQEMEPCGRLCAALVADEQSCFEERWGCRFDDEIGYRGECIDNCREAAARLGGGDRCQAQVCIDCVWDRVGPAPGCAGVAWAMGAVCAYKCAGESGMGRFLDEFEPPGHDPEDFADYPVGPDVVAACQEFEDHLNGLPCAYEDGMDMHCEDYADYEYHAACDVAGYFHCLKDCYGCDGDIIEFDFDKYSEECVPLAEC
jgi:hypothetical protein